MFVDRNEHGNCCGTECIDWIVKDWPVEAMPLAKQTTSIGVLFLDDTNQLQPTLSNPPACAFVPDRHMFATTSSPGSKMNQQCVLASKLTQ